MLSICTLYVGIHTVHSLEKQFGFRAFSNSPPRFWKAVPQTLREGTSSTVFHRHLQSWSVLSWVLSCCTVTDTSCPRPDLILIFCLSLSLSGFLLLAVSLWQCCFCVSMTCTWILRAMLIFNHHHHYPFFFFLQNLQQEYQVLTGKLEENSIARQVCAAQEMPQSTRGKCNIVLKVWHPHTTIGQCNIMYW